MRYDVKGLTAGTCQITLIPESEIERRLLIIKDDIDKDNKMETFGFHYQSAITSKFGSKAHLMKIDEISFPIKVYATFKLEGSIGNR